MMKEPLYQENGCAPNTYGTFQDHKVGPIHTRNLGPFGPLSSTRPSPWMQPLHIGEFWYAMNNSKSYCTRKMAASQSRTVHAKTHMIFPIHTRNIGPIGTLPSSRPSSWIELSPMEMSDMPWMVTKNYCTRKMAASQLYTVHSKMHRVCLIHKKICDPSVHHPVLDRQSPWIEPLPNRVVWNDVNSSKGYYAEKMSASQTRFVYSKFTVSAIHTWNIGPISPLSSTWPSPWIEQLPYGEVWYAMNGSKTYCTRKWLHPNHVPCITKPQGLSYSHKKYRTHQSMIQHWTITLN